MATVNIPSFRALAQKAHVSDWQIRQLRHGHATTMRLNTLLNISDALEISLSMLLDRCSSIGGVGTVEPTKRSHQGSVLNGTSLDASQETASVSAAPIVSTEEKIGDPHGHSRPSDALHLSDPSQLSAQPSDHALQKEYQRLQRQLKEQRETAQQTFQRTSLQALESWMIYWPAAVHAVQKTPTLPASRLIPLVKPVEQLLQSWGVDAIASVGAEVPFDPQCHQLIAGTADKGDRVSVSNPGYRHNDVLLHRAKVKAG